MLKKISKKGDRLERTSINTIFEIKKKNTWKSIGLLKKQIETFVLHVYMHQISVYLKSFVIRIEMKQEYQQQQQQKKGTM